MTGQLTGRKLQAMKTKNRVFEIAVRLINTYGYDQVSVEQICKEAGISIGGFYHHFKNKEGIIVESFKQIDAYFEEVAPEVHSIPHALERIVEYFLHYGKYIHMQGVDFTAQLEKSELSAAETFTTNNNRLIFTILQKIIEEGQANQQIREDIPAEKITSDLLRFARGIAVHWCACKGAYDFEKEITDSVRLYTLCIKPQ